MQQPQKTLDKNLYSQLHLKDTHRPNPIVQMGLFVDGDGIPLAFSLFPGNQNEQTSFEDLMEAYDRLEGQTEDEEDLY